MEFSHIAFLALVVVGFVAFAMTLMGASLYVALGERKPAEPVRQTAQAKRAEVTRVSPASHP